MYIKFNIIICVCGFIAGYLLHPFPHLSPVLFGGVPAALIALAARYLIIGKGAVQRFMLGVLFTMMLAFIPASLVSAISIWGFDNYDVKFGAYGAWQISNMIFAIIAFASAIGFTIWSTLMIRITRHHPTWCYLLVVAAPVAGCYALIYAGFLKWVMMKWYTESIFGYLLIGFAAYSPGIILSVIISLIWKSANKHLPSHSGNLTTTSLSDEAHI